MNRFILVLIILSVIPGCAHVISGDLRKQVNKGTPVAALFEHPDDYKGEIVVLGGAIAGSRNTNEGTYIEIVEKELDYQGRPMYTDKTHGRFIVLHDGFLDAAIYSTGRYITVAGEVIGKRTQPLGEIDYSYLFIKSRELHLVQPGERFPVHFGIGIFHSF
ncbi:MAG: Slp family lipoprotein [Nitrospirae bacterium]|nr:Slp family lipoprotein [Nitrospirota bacterium]